MKIPKPRQRGESFRIELMLDGKRVSATRDTAQECEQWAALKILEHKTGKAAESNGVKPAYPLRQLFQKYYDEVGRHKPGHKYITQQYNSFDANFGVLADMSIHDITPKHLTNWRNNRLKLVSAGTVLRQISLFSAVFSYAQKELFLIDVNPFSLVSKPKQPKARNMRITPDDEQALCAAFDYDRNQAPIKQMDYVAWAFLFALETAMRRGEILGIERKHIFDDYVHLPKTKNGDARDVPLTKEAKRLLGFINHSSSKLLPINENAFRLHWQRKAGQFAFTFHDTRHEAITRFVQQRKLPVEILAKITGHKTIKVLINTYYNPTASDIAKMLNGP